jgi:hypothetical protein
MVKIVKGLVTFATLFIYFVFINTYIYSHIHIILSSVSIRRGLSPFSSLLLRSEGKTSPGRRAEI